MVSFSVAAHYRKTGVESRTGKFFNWISNAIKNDSEFSGVWFKGRSLVMTWLGPEQTRIKKGKKMHSASSPILAWMSRVEATLTLRGCAGSTAVPPCAA